MIKKLIVSLLITVSIFTTAEAKVIKAPKGFYPHMGAVVSCKKVKKQDYYKVTFKDAEGRKWSWFDDNTDTWQKGDFVAVIMYDNGTKNVYDDCVVDARYVGCKRFF